MNPQPTLRTTRFTLRPLVVADWEPYAAMWADPRVTTFVGGEPRTRDVAWKSFGQAAGIWPLFGFGNWSVVDRHDRFLGICGFAIYERGIAALDGYPEAGWVFVPDSWGQGVAREAVGAIHDWADATGLGETRCLIDDGNAASIRVAERIGYGLLAQLDGKRVFRRPAPSPD